MPPVAALPSEPGLRRKGTHALASPGWFRPQRELTKYSMSRGPSLRPLGSFIPFLNFSMIISSPSPYNREEHPDLDTGLLPPPLPLHWGQEMPYISHGSRPVCSPHTQFRASSMIYFQLSGRSGGGGAFFACPKHRGEFLPESHWQAQETRRLRCTFDVGGRAAGNSLFYLRT